MSDAQIVPALVPVLAVEDVDTAVAFYGQLGFTEVFSIPDGDGLTVHAHLRKGDSVLFLGRLGVSHYEGNARAAAIQRTLPPDRGMGVTLILQVDNLVEIYDVVRRERLQLLAEPADEYYGDRVFFFIDPFGYEWKISQPLQET